MVTAKSVHCPGATLPTETVFSTTSCPLAVREAEAAVLAKPWLGLSTVLVVLLCVPS